MAHWRSFVESKYLSHFELQGRDVDVRIAKVVKSEVVGKGGAKNKKAVVTFDGKEKGMVMGVTCLSTIASIYGDDVDRWFGQWITIYPTTTEASGKTVGTIRVRPTAPAPRHEAARNGGRSTARAQPPAGPPPSDDNDQPEDCGDVPSPEEMGGNG